MDSQVDDVLSEQNKSSSKPPVVRGARACTVCRAAKMKCVGAEDGQKPCQRCKRANVECVFEKHRRGRKPGSKLSEASKMLRRLEKGLHTAKLKSQTTEASGFPAEGRNGRDAYSAGLQSPDEYAGSHTRFPSNELPPLFLVPGQGDPNNGSRSVDMDDDEEEDNDRAQEGMYPAKLIRKEHHRNSFFGTILNPEQDPPTNSPPNGHQFQSPPRSAPVVTTINDPVTAGLITEDDAKMLFDMVFLRLNPFVNLFDPALHTVTYVRTRSPFLFTVLIMAGCKFFKQELYKPCQKLAHELAVRAFAEAWKGVEVVQAFACLTYWKEPDDNRTWTYIGYACRMAVELGLNRYVARPPAHETEFQMLERRNRERTYLVLFVHDRSLSMQTGRHWMLPEDDFVRHSNTWHEEGSGPIRPEDVIVSAQVALRRIASETTDMFYTNKSLPGPHHNDVNYEVVLRNCNGKLTQWMTTWEAEIQRAGGDAFHKSFLSLFRLYVRLFLNSFGIQASMTATSRASPSLQSLSACFTSALETLRIVSDDFAKISMLRYSQDSVTVMTAYAAVFLLRLLRSSNTLASLHEGATDEIHSQIQKTAEAYHEASLLSPSSTSAAFHARFLRSLVANDRYKARQTASKEKIESMPIDPRLQVPQGNEPDPPIVSPTSRMYAQPVVQSQGSAYPFPSQVPPSSSYTTEYPSDPTIHNGMMSHLDNTFYSASAIPHATERDAHYWRHMFLELGYSDNVEGNGTGHFNDGRGMIYTAGSSQPASIQYHPQMHAGYSNN